jgi:O-antigen/teichoic acid export membrane protein
MSQATSSRNKPISRSSLSADSFTKSVFLISTLMVAQRGIGFLRSFYVCDSLSAEEVGRWDLAFGFLALVAPLSVFGIPGSFGRYLARYEASSQQSRFLRQTALVCLVLSILASGLIWMCRGLIGEYFFGNPNNADLVGVLAVGLPALVFFNFATSWFTGKRLNRFVFRIQFTQTLFFALLCVVMFQWLSVSTVSVVVSYLLSCFVATVLAAGYVMIAEPDDLRDQHRDNASLVAEPIWRKILPFAVWVWLSNALMNLFAVCDRLLLVNYYTGNPVDVQFLVGQYHTACIFPLLLMTVGAMAGSTGMPYLSKDWEAGDRDKVAERMNLMLKSVGLLCIAASVGILLLAPILFGEIWNDKFALGEALLPMTLCFCSLAAITMVAQKYFWCMEKTWISGVFLLIGLLVNFLIGIALIGSFGINGVVASTLMAHSVVLIGVLHCCQRFGMQIDRGVWVVSAAILAICLGKPIALCCGVATLLLAAWTPLFFTESFRRQAFHRICSLRLS